MNKDRFKYNERGLVSAIIQDKSTKDVTMLGYMNKEALERTYESGKVTFYSRSRNELWTKGETSGNYLLFDHAKLDCDGDAILIQASPTGPTCHQNTITFWGDSKASPIAFIDELRSVIHQRNEERPSGSYLTSLFEKGVATIAQKVGEEGVEVVIEAIKGDKERLREEAADLFFHYLVLLENTDVPFEEVVDVLKDRNN